MCQSLQRGDPFSGKRIISENKTIYYQKAILGIHMVQENAPISALLAGLIILNLIIMIETVTMFQCMVTLGMLHTPNMPKIGTQFRKRFRTLF